MKWLFTRLEWVLILVLAVRFWLYSPELGILPDQEVSLHGRVDRVISGRRYTEIRMEGYRIVFYGDTRVDFGDVISVRGRVNRNFLVEAENIEVKRRDWKVINNYRDLLVEKFRANLPLRESSLGLGILLGQNQNWEVEDKEKLRTLALTHVVVASGSNIALVNSWAVNTIVGVVGRRKATIMGIFLIWFYVVISGLGVPVVRAALMATMAGLGLVWGREANSWRLLFLSGILILLEDPKTIFDVSFQLSFVATFGVLVSAHLVERLEARYRKIGGWVLPVICAQLAVAPLIAFYFGGRFSSFGFLANLVVSPLVAIIMEIGLLEVLLVSLDVLFPLGGILDLAVSLWYPPLHLFWLIVDLMA